MVDSWKFSVTICWAATFVALLADEISENVAVGGSIHFASTVVFGVSVAVAFIAGCLAAANFVSQRRNSPL